MLAELSGPHAPRSHGRRAALRPVARDAALPQRSSISRDERRGARGVLSQRRAVRQGRRLRYPRARSGVRRAPVRQLFVGRRVAAVRDGDAAPALRCGVVGRYSFRATQGPPDRGASRGSARHGRCAYRVMKREEILINATPREVRTALVESGVLQEVLIERTSRRGLISNIYKGKVSRVLPGMQAAFVDLGLERTAFLHASDIARAPDLARGDDAAPQSDRDADIREFVHDGQELLVQILKEPLGTKGARLTTYITIPSRYLVMTPLGGGVGVSSRIEAEAERERLRSTLEKLIVAQRRARRLHRTHRGRRRFRGRPRRRHGVPPEDLEGDRGEGEEHTPPGELVHEDLPLPLRVLRDSSSPAISRVRVDSEPTYRARERVRRALRAASRAAGGAVCRGSADLRRLRHRRRDRPRTEPEGAAEIRRPRRVRPDRGDDDDRREHRSLRRPSQPRGDDLSHEPRGGRRDRPAAQAPQPRAASSSSTSST